jgi:hypothetical protein
MIESILQRLVFAAPALAAYVAGAVFASRRMQRHPGPSRDALLAFALLIAGWLIPQAGMAVFDYRRATRPDQMSSEFYDENMWLITQGAMAHTALFLAGIGLMLKAVHAEREEASREAMPEEKGEPSPPPSPPRELAAPAVPQGLSTSMNSVT